MQLGLTLRQPRPPCHAQRRKRRSNIVWPIQDIVLCLGLCARINTILCAPTLCLGTPPHTVTTRTIAQCNVSPRPPVIATYTTQYWQLQYLVKAKTSRQISLGAQPTSILSLPITPPTQIHIYPYIEGEMHCIHTYTSNSTLLRTTAIEAKEQTLIESLVDFNLYI